MNEFSCNDKRDLPHDPERHFELRNQMEGTIRTLVDQLMPDYDVCQCAKCHLDVMALALNHLPAHYVVTARGGLLAQVDLTLPQNQTDALSAVMQAIMTVQSRPRHLPETPVNP